MSIRQAVVALNTSNGNQDIEIGTGGQPSMFWIFATRATAPGSAVDTAYLGFCCGDGTNYWGQAVASEGGGIAASDCQWASFNDAQTTPAALVFKSSTLADDGYFSVAARAVWPTNGIRLVVAGSPSAAYRLHVVFVDAESAKVGTFTRNNTVDATTTIAPGFAADTMGFGTQKSVISPGSAWANAGFFSFGMADYNGSTYDNMAVNYYESDNQATPTGNAEISNTRCGWADKNGGNDDGIEVTNMRAGGGSDEVLVTSRDQAGNDVMGYFAIKWPTGVAHSLKAITGPSTTGSANYTVDLGGATPEFMLLCPALHSAYDTPTSTAPRNEALSFSHLKSGDGDCVCFSMQHGEADAYTKSLSSDQAVNVISMNGNAGASVNELIATITGVVADGVTLNYTMVNTASAKQWAFAVEANLSVPDAPTGLTAVGETPTTTVLTWTQPANTGGSELLGNKIERESPTGGGFSTIVADTGAPVTSYRDTGLSANTEYNYRVSAINAQGTGAASSADAATTPDPADNDQLSQMAFGLQAAWLLPLAAGDPLDRADRQHLLNVSRSPLFDTPGGSIIAQQQAWYQPAGAL